MKIETQFSVFLANKPGVLSQVCTHLAAAKVNIVALSMMDSSEHGVMRFISNDAARTRKALQALNLPLTETEVLVVDLPNKPGAFADVCDRLSHAHVNINYAYCSATAGRTGNSKTAVFLKVGDSKKAQKVLAAPTSKRRNGAAVVRRPVTRRR